MMITKADLRPTTSQRVRDVAQAVGISIDGWAPNDRHRNSRWSFGKAGASNLGFVWWKNLREDSHGNVYFLNDAGDWADKCRRKGNGRAAGKAEEFNNLINACYYGRQPVRVAIVDGDADPNDDDAHEKASKRELDDALWYPHHRDPVTGFVVVVRGVPQPAGFDPSAEYAASVSPSVSSVTPIPHTSPEPNADLGAQDGSDTPPDTEDIGEPPERKTSTTTAFARDSEVVRAVKLRVVDGKCECCGEQGFLTAHGGHYLEVHHVIPLSCKGLDVEWNALAICPNDHKMAHFGAARKEFRDKLIQLLGIRYPEKLEQLQEMARIMDLDIKSGEELENEVES